MLSEFLHSQLVLFGDFLKSKVDLKHQYEVKDGQIIVHQSIKRIYKEEGAKSKDEYIGNRLEDIYLERGVSSYDQKAEFQRYEEPDDENQSYEDDEPENYQQYSHNIASQYRSLLPELFNNTSPENSPRKLERIPFFSPKRQAKVEDINEEQQQQWVTEEEEEEYVTNELLEEAGGNFATEM